MPAAFQYRPKFVDIRVRPPKAGEAEAERDVHALKPGERACEHPGCLRRAEARAPKSREHMNDYYWFCPPHAAEYNRSWNFFEGMSDSDQERFRADAETGHRPTWQFKASRMSREAAAFAARFGSGASGKSAGAYGDAHGVFTESQGKKARATTPPDRRHGKLELRALAELDLEPGVAGPAIRTRYLDLVKRFHPDSNGGDRSSEQKLQRVIRAYKTLQAAKLT